MKKIISLFGLVMICTLLFNLSTYRVEANEVPETPTFKNVSVHDPSIIKVGDTFYIFGSHLASAKSNDLMNWEQLTTHVHNGNSLIPNVYDELEETFTWAESNTLWAADVIQLSDGKFYFYYNACRGDSPLSAMGIAVSDQVEGPYKDLGIILKSGMYGQPSYEGGPNYNPVYHPNVVDPDVFFDKDGKLWMTYGSYSGGIFILEMDPTTGFPLPDQGFGKKLMGGNHTRMEGPFVLYSPETDYYYLFISFGGLDTVGGYNIRVSRSKNPDGPYEDASGNQMINAISSFGNDAGVEKYGVKQIGNFLIKDLYAYTGYGYLSPGHNSAYYDAETGKYFNIFHTRFPNRGEAHEVRVHQMIMNKDGWPIITPYRYAGEELSTVTTTNILGDYHFINHGKKTSKDVNESNYVRLNEDGTISGDHEGSFRLYEDYRVEITMNNITYDGAFLMQWDHITQKYVMTFSALSNKGVTIWGSKMIDLSEEEIVNQVKMRLNVGKINTKNSTILLNTASYRGTIISWTSSNPDIVSSIGTVTPPTSTNSEPIKVTLTATIKNGSSTDTKSFQVLVDPIVVPIEDEPIQNEEPVQNEEDKNTSFVGPIVIGLSLLVTITGVSVVIIKRFKH